MSTNGENRAGKTQAKLENFTSASHIFTFVNFHPAPGVGVTARLQQL